jgi:hypothetical protein
MEVNIYIVLNYLFIILRFFLLLPVKDVVVTAVNWNNAELQRVKEKYRQDKEGWEARFEEEMRAKEERIQAGQQELERVKKEREEELKSLSDQLSTALVTSETERAAHGQRPEELIAMLAARHKFYEERVASLDVSCEGEASHDGVTSSVPGRPGPPPEPGHQVCAQAGSPRPGRPQAGRRCHGHVTRH